MDAIPALTTALVKSGISGMLSVRQRQELADRRVDIALQLGGALAVLAALAIGVCAVLVAAGQTFISGTEVLEAAVFTVVYSGIIVGVYAILGRSRSAPTQPAITAEERLAAARATALLASEGQQQRLEGAFQLEALAQVRPDLVAPAAQTLRGLIPYYDTKLSPYYETRFSPYERQVVLLVIQALSRLNPLLREQGVVLDLRLAILSELDLSGLDLRGADLTGADLTKSNLAGTDLTGANLTRAKLDGADLSQADLAYAYLGEASLDHATWATAHLDGTYLPSTAAQGPR